MKDVIEQFFSEYKKQISFNDLIIKLKLQDENIKSIVNSLYELECEGKIFKCEDDSYIHVPKEFYLKHGVVNRSSKGNLYVNLEHGDIALVPPMYETKVTEGDTIYFEPIKSEKHNHQFFTRIKRVVDKLKVSNNYLINGILCKDYNKDYFYVPLNKYDRIYIPNEYINGAFVSDEVTVRIINEDDEFIGKVEHIIKRKRNEHLFICKKAFNKLHLTPIGTYSFDIKKVPDGVYDGDCVLLDISDEENPVLVSKVEHPENDVNIYAAEYGFDIVFDNETLEEAKNIDGNILESEIESRVDLRNLITFTIDSASAKDLDDAVSLEVKDGKYILYVSIADVSYYVKPGTHLFKTACERTTSIYPANSVIPMLPKELSNGVCSLNEHEDKLTKTVKIIVDKNGNIEDFEIFNSVINSNMKMTYTKVNDILDGRILHDEYLPFYDTLREMNNLSKILQDRRMKRGFICFETEEYEYELDNEGNVIDVILREKGQSQLLIENFMLLANEMVADFIKGLDLKGAFRNHEAPSVDQVRKLKNKMFNLDKYIHILNNIREPKLLQKVLLTIFKDKSEEEVQFLSKIMLRSMSRAFYSTNNIGHYGLALSEYATFTSPIRRLPDLLNHLIIQYVIDGKIEYVDSLTEDFENLCIHASDKQLDADILEKNINYMLLNKFLLSLNGKAIEAKVKFIIKDFIYIKTNNGICGIIPLSRGNFNDGKVSINKDHINVGDDIYVVFEFVQDYTDDIVFNYLGKVKDVKKLERTNDNG